MSAKLATTPSLRVLSRDTAVAQAGSLLAGGLISNYDVAKDGRFLGLVSNKDDYQLIVPTGCRSSSSDSLGARNDNVASVPSCTITASGP
jgi:hypothetical protein